MIANTGIRNQTALVTGATRGIGWKFAKLLALRGYDLLITGRDKGQLELFERRYFATGVRIRSVVADLATPAGVEGLLRSVRRQKIAVDILINNAGFGDLGPFAESDSDRQLEMIQVNVASLVRLTRELLPAMVERGRGYVLNVSSTAAFGPGPLMATYFATKAFVLSFSEALWQELAGSGVVVSVLCPGATATEFDERAGLPEGRATGANVMDAERVAAAGLSGMFSGARVIVPGFVNRLAATGSRLAPRRLLLSFVERFNRRKDPRRLANRRLGARESA